jgi:hypothetical protein
MGANILLGELAVELGMDKSALRKWALKNGFTFLTVRGAKTQGQVALALTPEDADVLRGLRASQGYGADVQRVSNGKGWFYIIQLVPEFSAGRVKLGFAVDVNSRLQEHRCAAPTAQLIQQFPCSRVWEYAAIASVTREGCTSLSNEVFDCESIDDLVRRAEEFFALTPSYANGLCAGGTTAHDVAAGFLVLFVSAIPNRRLLVKRQRDGKVLRNRLVRSADRLADDIFKALGLLLHGWFWRFRHPFSNKGSHSGGRGPGRRNAGLHPPSEEGEQENSD